MRPKTLLIFLMFALLSLALAGCGGDDSTNTTDNNPGLSEEEDPNGEQTDTDSSTDGTRLALVADPNGELKYDTTKLNAKPGNITIALSNASTTPHDVAVKSGDSELGKSETITESETTLGLSDVEAGSYTFFCSLPGHEAAGMKGDLTVR